MRVGLKEGLTRYPAVRISLIWVRRAGASSITVCQTNGQ